MKKFFSIVASIICIFATAIAITGCGKEKVPVYVEAKASDVFAGTVTGGGDYNTYDKVIVTATVNEGYVFDGWYIDDVLVDTNIEYKFEVTEDTTIVGKFLGPIRDVILVYDSSMCSLEVEGNFIERNDTGNKFIGKIYSEEKINFYVRPKEGYECSSGVSQSSSIIVKGDIYCSIECQKQKAVKQGDNLIIGTYPQTLVTDKDLIEKLNVRSQTDTTAYWNSYSFYDNNSQEEHKINYIDLTYMDNKYRGIKFDTHIPNIINKELEEDTYSTYHSSLEVNTIYWFLWEDVKWKIIRVDGDKSLIVPERILNVGPYDDSSYDVDYIKSSVAKEALGGMYIYVFDYGRNVNIHKMTINYTLPKTYETRSTDVNLFLLTLDEIEKYELPTKVAVTDYALALGAKDTTVTYYTRPYEPEDEGLLHQCKNGEILDSESNIISVSSTDTGVYFACWVSLKK